MKVVSLHHAELRNASEEEFRELVARYLYDAVRDERTPTRMVAGLVAYASVAGDFDNLPRFPQKLNRLAFLHLPDGCFGCRKKYPKAFPDDHSFGRCLKCAREHRVKHRRRGG